MKRTSKRRKASAASGGYSGAVSVETVPAVPPAPWFDRLPDELLERVLVLLDASEAWRARSLCRRWRSVVERARFAALRVNSWIAEDLDDLASFIWRERLRLRDASVDLTLEVDPRKELDVDYDPLVESSELMRAASGVLRALAYAAGGMRALQLRSFVDAPYDDGSSYSQYYSAHLLALLYAFRPTAANPEVPRLESLSCTIEVKEPRSFGFSRSAVRRAFGHLSALRSLVLPTYFIADSTSLPAIAECLPGLRRLHVRVEEERDLSALAPLACLEELCVWQASAMRGLRAGMGMAGLAAGPAGRSLRSLRLAWLPSSHRDTEYNYSFTDLCTCRKRFHDFSVTATGVSAIARMPLLEELDADLDFGYIRHEVDWMQPRRGRDDTASLGAAPRLRSLRAHILLKPASSTSGVNNVQIIQGLADALRQSPSIRRLELCLHAQDLSEPQGFYSSSPPPASVLRELLLAAEPVLASARLSASPGARAAFAAGLRGAGALGPALAAAFEAGRVWRAGEPAAGPSRRGGRRRGRGG